MIVDRVGEGAKDDAGLAELILESRCDGNAVEHGIHRDAGQARALVQRNAELGVGREQLRIYFIETLRRVGRSARRRVVGYVLVIDGLVMHPGPYRFLHGQPMPERLQAPVEQKLRLALFLGYRGHDTFVETRRQAVGFDIRDKAMPVFLANERFDILRFAGHFQFPLKGDCELE